MEDNRTRAIVEIYGEEYIVRGDSPPEHIANIAQYVDKKMKQIGNRNPLLSITKIAVLTALNIADELSKLQEDYDSLVKLVDKETKSEKAKNAK
ncbi:MAG: cell division protein ZapA [Bacillota bacterium]